MMLIELIKKQDYLKKKEKTREFSETQYYNKVYKNTESKYFVNPNHFFADLTQFWSENDSIRNIVFKNDNILIKPEK